MRILMINKFLYPTNSSYNISGFVYDKLIASFTNYVFLFMVISAFGMCCGYLKQV